MGLARQPKTSGLASATAVPSNQTVEESLENLDNTSNSAKVPDRFRNPNHSAGAQDMKNVYEVLRQKEMELTRLEKGRNPQHGLAGERLDGRVVAFGCNNLRQFFAGPGVQTICTLLCIGR